MCKSLIEKLNLQLELSKVYFSPKSFIISSINAALPDIGVYTYDYKNNDFSKMRTRSGANIDIGEDLKPKLRNPNKNDFPILFQVQASSSYESFKVYHFVNIESTMIKNQCDVGLKKLSVYGDTKSDLATFNVNDGIGIFVTNFRNLETGKPAPEFLDVVRKSTERFYLTRNKVSVRADSKTLTFKSC